MLLLSVFQLFMKVPKTLSVTRCGEQVFATLCELFIVKCFFIKYSSGVIRGKFIEITNWIFCCWSFGSSPTVFVWGEKSYRCIRAAVGNWVRVLGIWILWMKKLIFGSGWNWCVNCRKMKILIQLRGCKLCNTKVGKIETFQLLIRS